MALNRRNFLRATVGCAVAGAVPVAPLVLKAGDQITFTYTGTKFDQYTWPGSGMFPGGEESISVLVRSWEAAGRP